jgi:tryptophan halogenase
MKITVVGAGTAGAFAGAWAKKNFPDATVTQIYSKDIPAIGVGESVTPHVWAFLQEFGIDQSTWMKDVNSEFKLSNCFEGWTTTDQHFGFTYNKPLDKINDYNFETYLKRTQDEISVLDVVVKLYKDKDISDIQSNWYEIFEHMQSNKIPNETKQIFSTSHHIDAQSISNWVMEHISKPLGVKFIEGTVTNITTSSDGISSVIVNGEKITSDYWLDCTGFNRLLVNEVDDTFVKYENNKANSSWVMPVERKDAKYYTRSIRNEFGWQFKISLQHRIGTGMVYSDEYFDDNEVLEYFKSIEQDNLAEPRLLKWQPGRLKNPRVGNVFAIGMAAGFVEPMEANALWHTLATVYRAIDTINYQNTNLFDDIIAKGYDDTALFILMHYTLCEKGNNKFWHDMREIGQKENHSLLAYQKYKQNTLHRVSYWYSMFPDFMWAQLASTWDADMNNFDVQASNKQKELVLNYLKSNRQNVFN